MPLGRGAQFAGYSVVRLLGVGGMGEVYLVRHPRLPRHEALKILRPDVSADPAFRRRFNREADLASNLWHPHIVGVHDRGDFHGHLWISMDYIDGLDASRLARERYPAGMPHREVSRIVTAVADALDYAHQRGLMHRDVKPANIMVSLPGDGGEAPRIMLTDFGIARPIGEVGGHTASLTVGTVSYSAPEQLMGHPIDGRADQYSLAATAYRLLTGAHLFQLTNPVRVVDAHLRTPPPQLSSLRPELASLDGVFARALAKNPADRFDRCTHFAEALDRAHLATDAGDSNVGGETVPAPLDWRPALQAAPPPMPGPPPLPAAVVRRPAVPPYRRGKATKIAAAIAAVIVVAAVATFAVTRTADEAPDAQPAQNRDAARLAGQQYLEALAAGDAKAAVALTVRPPEDSRLLTDEVLRGQLADLPVTDIDVTNVGADDPNRSADAEKLSLRAKFGPTVSRAEVLARNIEGQWKLDTTTIKLSLGTAGAKNRSLESVAIAGVATEGADPVAMFPGSPRVSSTNPLIDLTAQTRPFLLDKLVQRAGATIDPVAALNDAGRQGSFAAVEAWHRYCVNGGPAPPECCPTGSCRLPPPPGTTDAMIVEDTQRIVRFERSTNMTYDLIPEEMIVNVTGTVEYIADADTTNGGRQEFPLIVQTNSRVDITQSPPVVIPKKP
jgi:hypothetical protein